MVSFELFNACFFMWHTVREDGTIDGHTCTLQEGHETFHKCNCLPGGHTLGAKETHS